MHAGQYILEGMTLARDFEHIQYSDVEGLCGSVGLYGPKRLAILHGIGRCQVLWR